MGALADFTAYLDKTTNPGQVFPFLKNTTHPSTARPASYWGGTTGINGRGNSTGATPPTGSGEAPTRATTGAIGQENADAANELRVWFRAVNTGLSMALCLGDRLVHTSGLDGTSIAAQTVNSTALTRYTSGVGVQAAIEIYSAIGTTATTATASYTNQAGTAGRTTPVFPIGATGLREAARLIPLPLQSGDTGVRSVETITLAATTGQAGNFGVTLYKSLIAMPCYREVMDLLNSGDPLRELGLLLSKVETDACLWLYGIATGQTSTGLFGELLFMES